MLQNLIDRYYTFFDETLKSTTFVVLIITLIIFVVGAFVPYASAWDISYMKSSIIEAQNIETTYRGVNTVMIDGVEYELIFSKTK